MSEIKPNPTMQNTFQEPKNVENLPQQEKQVSKPYKTLKPDYITCPDYKDLKQIIEVMPHLKSLEENADLDVEKVKDSYSFIIRSNNDDDVHKSIKYGVWSSTPANNEMLAEVWKKAKEEDKDIYLFFSVVKSGQFVGVAKMTSDIQDETFAFWWQSHKWRHHCTVEWIFVKDITYKYFSNLVNSKNDPVIRSKDGTPVDWEKTGKAMLQIFKDAPPQQTIFNDFDFMDEREKGLRTSRSGNYQQNHYGGGNYYHKSYQQYNNYYGNYNQAFNNMYYMPMAMQFYGQNMGQFMPQQKFNNIYPPTSQTQYPKYNNNYQQTPNITNQNPTKPQ